MEHISTIVQEILERHAEQSEREIVLVTEQSSAENDAKTNSPDEEVLGVAS